jgi:hypothetical protein
VEVHCGPIHGTILYYVDSLVSGGANLIIELTRQCKGCVLFLNKHVSSYVMIESDSSLSILPNIYFSYTRLATSSGKASRSGWTSHGYT